MARKVLKGRRLGSSQYWHSCEGQLVMWVGQGSPPTATAIVHCIATREKYSGQH